MSEPRYVEIHSEGAVPIKAWVRGVPFEDEARRQLENVARLPFVHGWVAAMPDVHWGIGATVGSVIPTRGAIVPAAVGVDIGCGMMAVQTSLEAKHLPDQLGGLRAAIEKAVPHGFARGRRDRGAWHDPPPHADAEWAELAPGFERLTDAHPAIRRSNNRNHMGTLGSGNHFIEICLDEAERVWIMLHSGSRGVGNRIGTYFIGLARERMRAEWKNLPDRDLAWFEEGSRPFDDYVAAVSWAQAFAMANRRTMMRSIVEALRSLPVLPAFETDRLAVNCHHNYVARERHQGADLLVTRKGAVRAGRGELGIIPGSMGARSYIVRGLGCPESFESCSHGAGRAMSRSRARKSFSLADHAAATEGVECRKDLGVLDETPGAYKSIDAVMAAQQDLVEIVHTLRQVVCVKG
jgi:tRNA-splicing ligase RtcB